MARYLIEFPITVTDLTIYRGERLMKASVTIEADDPSEALDKLTGALEKLVEEQGR